MIGLPGVAAIGLYAVVLGVGVPHLLRDARWVLRAPRLAIGLWQALSAAWLISVVLLGLTLARPLLQALAWPRLEGGGMSALGLTAADAGLVLAFSIIARAGYMIVRELAWAGRVRRGHSRALLLAGTPAPALEATIVEHATPAVYCLPALRRRGTVVVSTGALRLLSEQELAAVVAHERGHLERHHHHVTAVAGAVHLAFPGVPLLRHADREIRMLAEMAADDDARRDHRTEALAAALLAVATGSIPERALGAAGHTVKDRLERMLTQSPPLAPGRRLATAAAAVATVALPIGLGCATVITTASLIAGRLLA
jgi:hypothetical protein